MIVLGYFHTRTQADRARLAVGTLAKVSEPYQSTPRNGRQWVIDIEVDVPAGYRTPNEDVYNRIIGFVQKYDGWVWDEEMP